MQKNRDPEKFIKSFKGIFRKIVTVKIPDEPNSCSAHDLQKIANQANINSVASSNIHSAIKILSSEKEKIIVCFGSLYLVGKILSLN